jgi:hypothetical protein
MLEGGGEFRPYGRVPGNEGLRKIWEVSFPLSVTPCLDALKAKGRASRKHMITGYLDSKATKFRLESLEDSLLEELCRKFVDKASSHLEEGL